MLTDLTLAGPDRDPVLAGGGDVPLAEIAAFLKCTGVTAPPPGQYRPVSVVEMLVTVFPLGDTLNESLGRSTPALKVPW